MRHVLSGFTVLAAAAALASAAPAGATTFGDLGCLQDPVVQLSQNCTSHTGLDTASAIGVSDDGHFVYVGTSAGQISVFSRDAFGAPHDVQCVTADGSAGACTAAPALTQQAITDVEVAGSNVYVGTHDGVLAAFARDPASGKLTPLGCMAGAGNGTGCTDAQRTTAGTIGSSWVAPTSNVVYAGGEGKNGVAISIYDRNSAGALSQSPSGASDGSYCVSDNGSADQGVSACAYVPWAINTFSLAFNASATRAYATANASQALMAFDRAAGARALTAPGDCTAEAGSSDCPHTTAVGLDDPTDVVVSPTTGDVYVSSPSSSTVAVFRPDLSEIGCIAQANTPNANGICARQARGITGANALALSPDGNHLYVAGSMGASVAELSIGTDGSLSQPAATCVSATSGSGCTTGQALDQGGGGLPAWDLTDAIATSRANTAFQVATPNVYLAASTSSALHRFSLSAPAVITLPTPTVPCTSASCQLILKCSKAHNCSVATSITVTGIKPRPVAKAKPVVVASGHFTVPKGKTKTLHARTTKAGRRLLAASRAKHRKKLRAQLTVKVKGEPGSSVFPITLRP
jgi:6-phosphogluconolactonase (cycloisomerase 2 family)